MSNINRDYLIILDVKKSTLNSPNIYFFNTDKDTSNIYVQLINIKSHSIAEIDNMNIIANIIKPNKESESKKGNLVNKDEFIFEFNLLEDYIDLNGVYKIEFEVSITIENFKKSITSFPNKFRVHRSVKQ